jgi:hypothetical protein
MPARVIVVGSLTLNAGVDATLTHPVRQVG